jgi:RNA-binding protein
MLKSKDRAKLRSLSNSININKYSLGKDSIKDSFVDMLDKALTSNEMIKISLLKSVGDDINSIGESLSKHLNAEIVQKIGRTITLYRQNPELKEKSKFKI